MTTVLSKEAIALGGDVSNSGEEIIVVDTPYRALVEVTGDCPILFHRWQSGSVEAKRVAAKGSSAKREDDIESYVWRNEENEICLPGEYLRCSVVNPRTGSARYVQDPRSTRKSAVDLFTAGIVSLTELAPITKADGTVAMTWDYVDGRRAVISRAGIHRERPTFNKGWKAEFVLMVLLPQYIDESMLRKVLVDAGRFTGVADYRPTYGRFSLTHFEILKD